MKNNPESYVKYPVSFLSRPCDRKFIAVLGDKTLGSLCAYRIWADFAISASDRRVLSLPLVEGLPSHLDQEVVILEHFCDWRGEAGKLVAAAISAGFLELKRCTNEVQLVCAGFYPLNDKPALTMQQKGAYKKMLNKVFADTDKSASDQLEIFDKTNHSVKLLDLSADDKKSAIRFVNSLVRVMQLKPLSHSDWSDDLLVGSLSICNEKKQEDVDALFYWLMVNRTDPEIPRRIDLIIKNLPDYFKKSKGFNH